MSKIKDMKNFLYLVLVSLILSSCFDSIRNLNQSQEFVQGSEDIPLLVGMKKIENEKVSRASSPNSANLSYSSFKNDFAISFDSSSGSIVSSAYESDVHISKVRKFYLETLPQMGWKISKKRYSKTIFIRDKETLEIEYDHIQKVNIVRFFISSSL